MLIATVLIQLFFDVAVFPFVVGVIEILIIEAFVFHFGEILVFIGRGNVLEYEFILFAQTVMSVEGPVGNRNLLNAVGVVGYGFPKGIFKFRQPFACDR